MKLEELRDKIVTLNAEIKANAKEALKSAFDQFFIDNPGVYGLKWTQYTPYFNDGEPCEFSKHDIDVLLEPKLFGINFNKDSSYVRSDIGYLSEDDNDEEEEVDESGLVTAKDGVKVWMHLYIPYKAEDKAKIDPRAIALTEKLNLFDSPDLEDVYQYAFGDGVKVTVTKDGIEVEDYDHD